MKKAHTFCLLAIFTLMTMALTACSPQVIAAQVATITPTAVQTADKGAAPVNQTFSDPFAYCAAVGTIDTPDAHYIGPKIPDAVIEGYKKAAGLEASTEPMEMFKKTTIWRCMNSQVYACNFGANLPCDSKANTDKTPSQAMKDFCQANPNSDFIPMSVTGHTTIYSWHCVKDAPELLDQVGQVDAAGYLSQIWYAIEPNVPANAAPTLPPADTPAAPAAVGAAIQPLTVEVCDGEAQAMAHALDVIEVTQAEVPLADPILNKSGMGCQGTVTGTGVKFKSPETPVKALSSMLVDEGWTEDPKLAAGGPTGMGVGYRKGSQICLADAIWQPDASANCSKDQPISACNVKPDQQNYTITLLCGVENP